MSYAVMPMSDWRDIVDSVRSKTGKSDTLKSGEVANEIDSIRVGGGNNTFAEYIQGTINDVTAEVLARVTSIKAGCFSYTNSITSVEIPDNVTSIGDSAFQACMNIQTVTIGAGLKIIGTDAFRSCRFKEIIIPNNVTNIYNGAFQQSALESIEIGNGVITLGGSIFNACTSLTNVILPDNLSGIPTRTFYQCSALPRIKLGKAIKTIDSYAFSQCLNIKEFICLAENPPSLASNALNGVPTDCIFKVLPQSVEAYKSETNWSARGDYIIALTPEEVLQYGG